MFRKLFKRAKPAENTAPAEKVSVPGITESDWIKIYNTLVREYNEAKSRQKSSDAKPSNYMRGLTFAMKAMETIRPYNIMEVHHGS